MRAASRPSLERETVSDRARDSERPSSIWHDRLRRRGLGARAGPSGIARWVGDGDAGASVRAEASRDGDKRDRVVGTSVQAAAAWDAYGPAIFGAAALGCGRTAAEQVAQRVSIRWRYQQDEPPTSTVTTETKLALAAYRAARSLAAFGAERNDAAASGGGLARSVRPSSDGTDESGARLAALAEEDRESLIATVAARCTYREIAAVLGTAPATVASRLGSALRHLAGPRHDGRGVP